MLGDYFSKLEDAKKALQFMETHCQPAGVLIWADDCDEYPRHIKGTTFRDFETATRLMRTHDGVDIGLMYLGSKARVYRLTQLDELSQAISDDKRAWAAGEGLPQGLQDQPQGTDVADAPEAVEANVHFESTETVGDDKTTAGHSKEEATIEPYIPQQDDVLADKDRRCTEVANARRLVAKFGADIRYCKETDNWYTWNGRQWERDKVLRIEELAKKTANDIFDEAREEKDMTEKTRLGRHAAYSNSRKGIANMVALARSEPEIAVTADMFDSNRTLLGCRNGVIDLETGKLRPSNREDYITKSVPVEYDPNAECPTWNSFLGRVMDGDTEMIAFLQRAIGYSLTGLGKEQVWFLLHGEGSNGKTTLVETLLSLMGGYGWKSQAKTFMVKPGNSVPTEIAHMAGYRFVAAMEADSNSKFAVALIKELTGEDTMTSRFLFEDEFQYHPQLKLWVGVNHLPRMEDQTYSTWRRVCRVPFDVTITNPDLEMREKLRAELPGILAWAVRGCLEWQKHGLCVPERVKLATESYRRENDVYCRFLDECTETVPGDRVQASVLYKAYVRWCSDSDIRYVSSTKFGEAMTSPNRGLRKVKSGSLWYEDIVLVGE